MSARSDIRNQRESEILSHFAAAISELGLEGASIAKVAARMDCPPSLIMHYYKTKDDLIEALFRAMVEEIKEQVLEKDLRLPSPGKRFKSFQDLLFNPMRLWDQKLGNPSIWFQFLAMTSRNDRIHSLFLDYLEFYRSVVRQQLEDFMQLGMVRKTDPEALTDLVICFADGLTHRLFLKPEISVTRLRKELLGILKP
ncbi:MAG: hypothetical protein CMN76_21445 [Spirochaetaceae bacterium]|nr:hypothetical protein [Spirochaetaceae bacterium]|tara:strand:+ start:9877 stop:10467 length:591 start_codon:yes stop_codon:yes gene_type:complete